VTDSKQSDELQPLTMSTSWPRPDVCVVELAGELDVDTAPALADYLRSQTTAGPAYLLLDLTAVTFIAAAGVTLIVNALRNDWGIHGRLHVIGPTDNLLVERVLDLTGVRALLPHHHDVEHALRQIDHIAPS
jgi:anti-anti-sigma factor